MRIDKYLWSVRVFKTRSMASDACKSGKVMMSEQPVKASKEIRSGDEITVRFNPIKRTYKVKELPKSRVGAKLVINHMEEITAQSELDKLEALKLADHFERDRGAGRPTKKQRRDIERYFKF